MSNQCKLQTSLDANNINKYYTRGLINYGQQVYISTIRDDNYPYFLTIVPTDLGLAPIFDPRPPEQSSPVLFTIEPDISTASFMWKNIKYYLTISLWNSTPIVWTSTKPGIIRYETFTVNPWPNGFMAGALYNIYNTNNLSAYWLSYVADISTPPSPGQQPTTLSQTSCYYIPEDTSSSNHRSNIVNSNIDSTIDSTIDPTIDLANNWRSVLRTFNLSSSKYKSNNCKPHPPKPCPPHPPKPCPPTPCQTMSIACQLFPGSIVNDIVFDVFSVRLVPIQWFDANTCSSSNSDQAAYQREVDWSLSWQTSIPIACGYTNQIDCQDDYFYDYCLTDITCGSTNKPSSCKGPCPTGSSCFMWPDNSYVCYVGTNTGQDPITTLPPTDTPPQGSIWQQAWFITLMFVILIFIIGLITYLLTRRSMKDPTSPDSKLIYPTYNPYDIYDISG